MKTKLNAEEMRRTVEAARQRGLINGPPQDAKQEPREEPEEISAGATAKLLGVHRTSLSLIVNYPLAQKLLRWRWSSERQGKRLFERASVLAYKERTKDPEYGAKSRR